MVGLGGREPTAAGADRKTAGVDSHFKCRFSSPAKNADNGSSVNYTDLRQIAAGLVAVGDLPDEQRAHDVGAATGRGAQAGTAFIRQSAHSPAVSGGSPSTSMVPAAKRSETAGAVAGLSVGQVSAITRAVSHTLGRVSFEEASALFRRGGDYLEIFDDAHSDEEDRFIAIGPIKKGLVLVVYTERDEDTVRLISARWATKRETDLCRSHAQGGAL